MLDVIIRSEGSMVHKSRVAKDSSLVDLPSLKLTWPLKLVVLPWFLNVFCIFNYLNGYHLTAKIHLLQKP